MSESKISKQNSVQYIRIQQKSLLLQYNFTILFRSGKVSHDYSFPKYIKTITMMCIYAILRCGVDRGRFIYVRKTKRVISDSCNIIIIFTYKHAHVLYIGNKCLNILLGTLRLGLYKC